MMQMEIYASSSRAGFAWKDASPLDFLKKEVALVSLDFQRCQKCGSLG
jgi:hypothetical protein